MGGGVESVWLGVSEGQVTQYSRIGKFTYSYVTQNVGYNQKSWTFIQETDSSSRKNVSTQRLFF